MSRALSPARVDQLAELLRAQIVRAQQRWPDSVCLQVGARCGAVEGILSSLIGELAGPEARDAINKVLDMPVTASAAGKAVAA